MAGTRLNCTARRRGRRWSFASCVLDEDLWSLFVKGRRVNIEAKPLELLHELLLASGKVVSKEELFDRIWPDVTVVEASLPTAVHKLRTVLGDGRRERAIIETVPGLGYRLAVPVSVQHAVDASSSLTIVPGTASSGTGAPPGSGAAAWPARAPSARLLSVSGTLAILIVVGALALGGSQHVFATKADPALTQRDAANALRKLDVGTIEKMLAAGWNPNAPFDKEGNSAINVVLNRCEWDRGYEPEQMVLMVRTLVENGARLDRRNVWGDTPYSIAKAVRYCGPNHPVTRSIRSMCYSGYRPIGDACLAAYEIAPPAADSATNPFRRHS